LLNPLNSCRVFVVIFQHQFSFLDLVAKSEEQPDYAASSTAAIKKSSTVEPSGEKNTESTRHNHGVGIMPIMPRAA